MDFLTSVPRRAAKFARLRTPEKSLFLRIVLMLIRVRLALWFKPLAYVRRMGELSDAPPVQEKAYPLSAHDLTSLITVAASYIPGATCLTQALVAQTILRRYGYAPDLKIGVGRSESNRFQAHAWIELDGKVVLGQLPTLSQYTPLPALPIK
jgi:hypothetical protein